MCWLDQPIQHEDLGKLEFTLLGWKALGLALEDLFLVVGEARIASPCELASHNEAVLAFRALALLLERA